MSEPMRDRDELIRAVQIVLKELEEQRSRGVQHAWYSSIQDLTNIVKIHDSIHGGPNNAKS
jgi:hypothetical protein